MKNSTWARLARILTTREITSAELRLLHTLGWDLSIKEQDLPDNLLHLA